MPAELPSDPRPESAGLSTGRGVLIDALAARFGGTAYATVQLARHLALRPDISTVIVLARRGSIVERGVTGEPAVRCITLPAKPQIELLRRIGWQALRLPTLVAREECDVVISMSGMLPRAPGCRMICLLFNPVMYERRTAANVLRRWAVRRTAHKAEQLAAPSRLMSDLVSASTGLQCALVPLGVDHAVFSPAASPGEEILCVADFYAHKRHDLVLDAWLCLPSPRPRLRLVGNPTVDRQAYARLLARIETLPEANSIVVEYGVALDRLVRAYHGARVFVMPSEHESFCMPLAESMACGVPAVVRGLASLRETGGAGARYVDGNDPAQWAATLQKLLGDDVEHRRMRALALRAADRFSWDAFAASLATRL
jgi:glycosyltransferase involved in cell wall biosynthesis